MKIPERITTERLVLRQPRLDDAGRVFEEYGRDPEVTRYLTWTPLETIKQAEEFLGLRVLAGWVREEEFSWAITRADSNMLIGMIACRLNEQGAELGFVLGRRYWNQGYVTEAARAVMDQAFSFLTVSKVWATCDVENLASARVLEKVGMTRERILKRWVVRPSLSSEPRDAFLFARVREGANKHNEPGSRDTL